MQKRRRVKQIHSLEERLAQEVQELRRRAKGLSPGQERESLLRRAQQHEEAAHTSEWLTPQGLRAASRYEPPTERACA